MHQIDVNRWDHWVQLENLNENHDKDIKVVLAVVVVMPMHEHQRDLEDHYAPNESVIN